MNRVTIHLFLLCFVYVLLSLQASANEVETQISPKKIEIGEHAELSFLLEIPPGTTEIIFPLFNEKISDKIEIISYGEPDTLQKGEDEIIQIRRWLTITSWESGFHPVEPHEFGFVANRDTVFFESQPLLLEVTEFALEEQAELKDIKDILNQPVTFTEILPWVLLVLLLAVISFFLIKYIKNRRKKKGEPESIWEKPEVPAHIAAISSLEGLKAKKLWEQGYIKQYYIELTGIIRQYIEKRFDVDALEMTTPETLAALQSKLDSNTWNQLKDLLESADLVKFAKFIPDENHHSDAMENAFDFVHLTRENDQEKTDDHKIVPDNHSSSEK
ncbi:MAG: hypothetical protein ACLFQS_00860 [Bacteroidales bacterium]